ncbi:MAG: type II toxin-antitoxin system VapC family toxin [Actinomycetota bacterium]|nr:type II toxin-antitoxin system VapC family toxin [Actinomycetota bacterium]
MSQTIDANILVYATHTGSPFHQRARALIEHLVAGPALAYILWPAILGYLRIITHPTILGSPLSIDEAIRNVENVLSPPHIRVAGEGDDFWGAFRRVATDTKPRGTLVPDAHLAALMHEHGVSSIWSHDRDFRKFSGLRVKDPFDDRYSAGFE